MNQPILDQIMEEVNTFPSIPGSASELLSVLRNPEVEIDRIEQVLRTDPGLTANILKLTNSSYFGFANRIGSIRQAVLLLGHVRLRQIVMVSCVNSVMDGPVAGYELPIGALWDHSIAVSVAAEGLVRELEIRNAEEIFTAALLHDLGKLILGKYVERHAEAFDSISDKEMPHELVEKEILGIDHAEVGAVLLEAWGLPEGIVAAVRWHHDPESAGRPQTMTDIVHMADVLSLMAGFGVGREGLRYQMSSEATRRVGIRSAQIERVASGTMQWMAELAEVQG